MTMHTLTAFFESRERAEAALAKLRQAGIVDANLRVSPEVSEGEDEPETGFWASLKEIFGAAPEYPAYREGVRRGAVMIVAHVDEAQLDNACGILDEHGSIDLDERERQWRQEGWQSEPTATTRGAQDFSSDLGGGSATPGALQGTIPGPEPSSASASFGPTGQPETLPTAAEQMGKRALNRGRVHIHDRATSPESDEPLSPYLQGASPVAEELRQGSMADTETRSAAGLETGLSTRLAEDMEVLGADGQHVGVIDHIEGASIELKKDDPAAHGQHHFIPLDWIASVDTAAKLKLSAADAWTRWTAA